MAEHSNSSQDQSIISSDCTIYPRVQLSLEFRSDLNSASQRQLCDDFWRLVEQHPDLEKIEEKGWSGKAETLKGRQLSLEKQLPCDNLKQLVEKHGHLRMSRKKCHDKNKGCLIEKTNSEESLLQLREDLKEYDSKIVPLQCIPPSILHKSSKSLQK